MSPHFHSLKTDEPTGLLRLAERRSLAVTRRAAGCSRAPLPCGSPVPGHRGGCPTRPAPPRGSAAPCTAEEATRRRRPWASPGPGLRDGTGAPGTARAFAGITHVRGRARRVRQHHACPRARAACSKPPTGSPAPHSRPSAVHTPNLPRPARASAPAAPTRAQRCLCDSGHLPLAAAHGSPRRPLPCGRCLRGALGGHFMASPHLNLQLLRPVPLLLQLEDVPGDPGKGAPCSPWLLSECPVCPEFQMFTGTSSLFSKINILAE